MNRGHQTPRCDLEACAGLNADGTCPMGYGVTCGGYDGNRANAELAAGQTRSLTEILDEIAVEEEMADV